MISLANKSDHPTITTYGRGKRLLALDERTLVPPCVWQGPFGMFVFRQRYEADERWMMW